ncbi:MAG: gliding motility lipoprotein GldH [Bacteroidetes bacterium]|nr:gliding motility lipoprotein GldH [Bacteroidota bacterium]
MISRRARSLITLVVLVISLFACSEKPYYEEYQPVAKAGWYADSLISFEVEIEDTLSSYRIFLNFRGTNDYPFSNLYLFRKIYNKGSEAYSDTVNFIMADPYGKWLGEGMGAVKTFVRMYRRQPLRFNQKGKYRFELQQAMRENPLPGIKDVGITIYKVADGKKEN